MRVAAGRREALASQAAFVLAAFVLAAFALACLAPGRAVAAGPCGSAVTVAAGDTLAAIAKRCGIGLQALLQANPEIDDPRKVRAGSRLRLPEAGGQKRTSGAAPASPAAAPPAPSGGAPRAAVGPANRDGLTRDGWRPRARGVQGMMVSPPSGAPGSTVQVEVMGLPPGPAELRAGLAGGDWQRLARIDVPDSGRASLEVTVPDWAEPGDPLLFTVQPAEGPALAGGSFAVMAPEGDSAGALASAPDDGQLVATGELRQDGACMLLQTAHGHLYALAAEDWSLTPGATVRVTGRPGEGQACGGARGSIAVSALRPQDGGAE